MYLVELILIYCCEFFAKEGVFHVTLDWKENSEKICQMHQYLKKKIDIDYWINYFEL